MKVQTFQELTTRIVNLSTRDKSHVSISFSGQTAYTSSKTLNIPALPSGTILSQHQFSIWLGYVIHEGPGHQTHSDLDLYSSAAKQRNNPTFSYILNLLEDIRIENCDISLYPGDRKYLDIVHHFVDTKIPPQVARNPDILGLIYKHLYVVHRNLDTNIILGQLTDQKLIDLLSKINLCSSTQDVIQLADRVVEYLKQKQEETKQEEKEKKQNSKQDQDQSQSSNSNPGDEGEDEEKGQEESKSSPSPSGDGNNNGLGNESKSNENNEESISQGNSGNSNQIPNSPDPSFDTSASDVWQKITEIKSILSSLKSQTLDDDPNGIARRTPHVVPNTNTHNKSIFPPADISNDRIYVPSQENLNLYTITRNKCSSQILSLKKMFRIYLQAQTQKATLRGLEEGNLDPQRLYAISTGSKTIFKISHTKLLPNTCVELMIDLSGSMNAHIARTSAIILAEALSSISEIKLSISGFTTNSLHTSYADPPPNSGRHNGMDILQFKSFSEPYAKCKAKLGGITNSGLTPLGDAYGKALEHIIPRPESRKIIFLITDGKPQFIHGKNHSDFLLMKKIHTTAKKFKIQTPALGIGPSTDFLSEYFDKTINISDPSSLPQNLLSALKSFI